jgi:hypothetical protein
MSTPAIKYTADAKEAWKTHRAELLTEFIAEHPGSRPYAWWEFELRPARSADKFVAGLRQAFQDGQLTFHGDLSCLALPRTFAAWLRTLFRKDWVVYAKPPFGGPEYVLQYLGRYTHRVAISNHRLVSFAEGKVTFR